MRQAIIERIVQKKVDRLPHSVSQTVVEMLKRYTEETLDEAGYFDLLTGLEELSNNGAHCNTCGGPEKARELLAIARARGEKGEQE